MTEFSGALRERATLERRAPDRSASGGRTGRWLYDGAAWIGVMPMMPGEMTVGASRSALPRWQVTMRKREGVDIHSRLVWRGKFLQVRSVISDPKQPAHMILTTEEIR
jgi:head-tail adaptor